jgi:L-threonylcarbamoyladenylate synthase
VVFCFSCDNGEDLRKCAELIDAGSIVVYPTDTVYGIGCDPFNDDSVLRLFKIKNRPLEKHLPILASNMGPLTNLVKITKEANILINHFWPGQLTLILKLNNNSLTSKYAFDNTVAVRIPDNLCITNLIQLTKNKLLVGTSANLSSQSPFSNLQDIKTSNLKGYDAAIDGGKLNSSLSVSTIVDLVDTNNPKIIRDGVVSKEKIYAVIKEFS